MPSQAFSLLRVHTVRESSLKSLTMRSPRVSGGVCARGGPLSVRQCPSPPEPALSPGLSDAVSQGFSLSLSICPSVLRLSSPLSTCVIAFLRIGSSLPPPAPRLPRTQLPRPLPRRSRSPAHSLSVAVSFRQIYGQPRAFHWPSADRT